MKQIERRKMKDEVLELSDEDEELLDKCIEESLDGIPVEDEDDDTPLHVYKNTKPKMCERKDFILIDLLNNNCLRLSDLMLKMNKVTEKLLDVDIDALPDEEYHKLLKTADEINKMLVQLGTMI
jgi:hypothetical protein